MKFSAKEDIEAPAEQVFDSLSDFAKFERAAMRRGAEVARVDRLAEPGVGLTWSLRFPVRGKMRRIVCELERFERPEAMNFTGESTGFNLWLTLNLMALSRGRTRLTVVFEIKPRTLTARLTMQSIRLNKASYARRFEARVQKYASEMELRHIGQRMP